MLGLSNILFIIVLVTKIVLAADVALSFKSSSLVLLILKEDGVF